MTNLFDYGFPKRDVQVAIYILKSLSGMLWGYLSLIIALKSNPLLFYLNSHYIIFHG